MPSVRVAQKCGVASEHIVGLLRLVPDVLKKSIAYTLPPYHAVRDVNERVIQPLPRGPHNRWRLHRRQGA